MDGSTGILFWGFLVVYGIVMYVISPKTVSVGGFFRGEDRAGRDANPWMITASIFIAWIFAKSVTNAANMGASFGIVGGIGYAVYWLCIPLTGWALYRLRRKFGATGLVSFLTEHYGVAAAFCFSAAILVRLFNEVWSNTSVVGAYYGSSGSAPFVIAAILFTFITVAYCCRGGMRGSLITDVVQAVLFAVLLIGVLVMVVPMDPLGDYVTSGVWSLEGGVDFIIGAGLQCLSYGFHDAVLTDRGFLCEEKKMLKSFTVAGLLGFVAIVLFSLIGVHAYLNGISTAGSSAPVVVSQSLGIMAFFAMAVIMISTAGSTLDSTFTALGKLTARDLPGILGYEPKNVRLIGIVFMLAFAVIGNLPMIMGADIITATTISGTMIMGLGPIFLLHGVVKPTKLGFHLAFWIGMVLGVVDTVSASSLAFMNIGTGAYANFLGVNFWGAILCWIGYVVPGLAAQAAEKRAGVEPTWKGLSKEELAARDAEMASRERALRYRTACAASSALPTCASPK
ncbi:MULTISPECIES: sodium:solute symporter [unclassified Adlercreutzia]|uniref:sodium:solute symporter family transporter n=1 Tax=unclassified Adlercreutzia TaxID=2636013 RepID=UPI0013EE16FF|nr:MULTISPECIES: sodium:solute symporter [unclassified Adlercreutzia]